MKQSVINRLVRNEIRSVLIMAKNGCIPKQHMDSMDMLFLTKPQREYIRGLAYKAIKIHDSKYNDLVGTAAVSTFIATKALPILLPFLGPAIAGMFVGPIATKVVNPILNSLIDHLKELVINKGNKTYSETIIRNIKRDIDSLIEAAKREGAYLKPKFLGIFKTIRNLV